MTPPDPKASRWVTCAFGLATFKIGIAPFDTEKKEFSANYICEDHGVKVQQRWYCEPGDHYIERDLNGEKVRQPVKGYPYNNEFVILTPEKIEEIQIPKMNVVEFDSWDDTPLDPVYVDKTYLVWGENEASKRTLDSIASAMHDGKFCLFGETCLYKTTHLMCLKWSDALGIPVLHQLHLWPEMKMREAAALATSMANRPVTARKIVTEVKRVRDAVLDRGANFDMPNHAQEALKRAIEEIATGGLSEELTKKDVPVDAGVPDLLDALRKSVAQAAEKKDATKKPPARRRKGDG